MLNSIIQGDCLEVMPGIADGSIDMIITSPIYNCRKAYDNTDDQLPWPEYYQWIDRVLDECYRVLTLGGVLAVNIPGVVRWQAEHKYADTWGDYDHDYQNRRDGQKVLGKGRIEPVGFNLLEMMRQRDSHIREPIVWVKGSEDNAICSDYRMGCDSDPYMRPAHELILLGSKGRWFHRGGTGWRGREALPFMDYTKDVWFVTPESHKDHPAVFPVEIPKRLIQLFTHAPDSVILDPFMGRGATAVAAKMLGRDYIGIDKSPKYCRIAQKRADLTGRQITLPGPIEAAIPQPIQFELEAAL